MNMLHRGPNGDGFYFEQHIGLAMRRLSIIDLEGGWQPIYNEDKSLILFMNGEIYNYVEPDLKYGRGYLEALYKALKGRS